MNDYTPSIRAATLGMVIEACEAGRMTETEWDPAPLDGFDALALDAVLVELGRITAAAKTVRAEAERLLASDIQTNGPIRLGDDGVYVGRKRTTRLIDPEGVCRWVADTAGVSMVGKAFRLEPRLTVLRGIATDAGIAPRTVIDTFFEVTEDDEPTLLRTRAKWVERLEHGQRRNR